MANTELMDTEDELKFYQEVHAILDEAKSKIYEAANNIMTYAYWNVGKRIIEQEQKVNIKIRCFGANTHLSVHKAKPPPQL